MNENLPASIQPHIELDSVLSLKFVSIVSQDEQEVMIRADVSNADIGQFPFAINDMDALTGELLN